MASAGPLAGRKLLVARAETPRDDIGPALEASGATVMVRCVLTIEPPEDIEPLDSALRDLERFDWVVLTSANTVRRLAERLALLHLSAVAHPQTAAIGETTSRAVRDLLGWSVDLMPDRESSDGLARRLRGAGRGQLAQVHRVPQRGANPGSGERRLNRGSVRQSVLLPQSNLAGDDLATELKRVEFEVHQVVAYRVAVDVTAAALAVHDINSGAMDGIVLTSPSAAHAIAEQVTALWPPVVVLGERTADACSRLGIPRVEQARDASPGAVVRAFVQAINA